MPEPDASEITVLQVLEKLDGDFKSFSDGFLKGEYSFWIGSGISRSAPDLGRLLKRGIEFLRVASQGEDWVGKFSSAFEEVMQIANYDEGEWRGLVCHEFESWPECDKIIESLWDKYSLVLDVRLEDEEDDYILWNAIDIRAAFQPPPPPAPEHLCIAALILEGVVTELASANWDTFIEQALASLSDGKGGILQVVVEPEQLRSPPGKAKLLKFHGCVKHASEDPATFRKYLTGSTTQINGWPTSNTFSAVRHEFQGIASRKKTLGMGLSLQDHNLHQIILEAKKIHSWPWPCDPNAPAYIFCENKLSQGQGTALKEAYSESYNAHVSQIKKSAHMKAWPEQVLVALLIQVVFEKLKATLPGWLKEQVKEDLKDDLLAALESSKKMVAGSVGVDRVAFVTKALQAWPRVLSIFKYGQLPRTECSYQTISSTPIPSTADDESVKLAEIGKLACCLGLLQHGHNRGRWHLQPLQGSELEAGAFRVKGAWDGASARPIFIVKTVTEALKLAREGAFEGSDAIVLHGDDLWPMVGGETPSNARSPRSAPGRSAKPTARAHHVSLTSLLKDGGDLQSLQERLGSEVAI
ncbi:SIR2 family protein [Salipiger thiooxidans]|uniref:SIR2 family protein n=1 Tax=Salipiger thiooxidans TaxID=282683 RepID=UPI001CD6A5E5|nr:SIR2 family protein [Salipiger thiooxidans]MCA0846061.1 SIR2 family protein [Salipiger thiooxidans]